MSTEAVEIVKAGEVKREIARRMPSEIAPAIEAALMTGDLKGLSSEHRVQFYHAVCESLGLNPLTRPFDYTALNGKLILYARKDCTEQLRAIHDVTVKIISREMVGDAYVVKSRALLPNGREDESIGAVAVKGLTGEQYANALMKAETKSKRRVTLSICGLGFLDETEVDQPRRSAFRYEASEEDLRQIPATTEASQCEQTGSGSAPNGLGAAKLDSDAAQTEPVKSKKPAGIDREQAKEIMVAFEAALPQAFRKNTAAIFQEWLGIELFIDKEGNPAASSIPADKVDHWKKKAVEWASRKKSA